MSTSLTVTRPNPSRRTHGPSIREACLVGNVDPDQEWAAQERISLSGRIYRVSAITSGPGATGEAPRYAHLVPLAEG